MVPKDGARICGKHIPGGTVVGIHYLSIHTQEQYFAKPLEFHPQRWLGDPEFENDRLEMAKPFLMGPMNCIGKVRKPCQSLRICQMLIRISKDLAMHELRLVSPL